MKTKVCILSACLFFFLTYTGLTPTTERLNDNGDIELSDKVLDSVTGGTNDMVCWDFCPEDAGVECDVGKDCSTYLHIECPGGEFDAAYEATACVGSDNWNHICNAGTSEPVECTNGFMCICWEVNQTCAKFTLSEPASIEVPKDC